MNIYQISHTCKQKRKKKPNRRSNWLNSLSAYDLKKNPHTYFPTLKPWQLRAINYLIRISNNCQEIYPMQETLGEEYVTRESVHLFLHELDDLGFIKILNRGKYRTCLYMLNEWFYNPFNRSLYQQIFWAMKYFTIHYLMPHAFTQEKPSNAERFYLLNNPILSHFPTQDNKLTRETLSAILDEVLGSQKTFECYGVPPP